MATRRSGLRGSRRTMRSEDEGWYDLEAATDPARRPSLATVMQRVKQLGRRYSLQAARAKRTEKLLAEEREKRRSAEAALRRRKADIRELQRPLAQSPVVSGGVAGRPALEAYRNTQLGELDRILTELDLRAEAIGAEGASFAIRRGLLADLLVTRLVAARSIEEARRRDLVEIVFSDPVLARSLAKQGRAGERWRADVWTLAMRSGTESSAWAIFQKSSERAPGTL